MFTFLILLCVRFFDIDRRAFLLHNCSVLVIHTHIHMCVYVSKHIYISIYVYMCVRICRCRCWGAHINLNSAKSSIFIDPTPSGQMASPASFASVGIVYPLSTLPLLRSPFSDPSSNSYENAFVIFCAF